MANQGVTYSQLQDLMEDFYHLTKIRISFWSATGEKLFMAQPPATLTFVQSYARSTASIMLVTVVINKRYETRINSEINFIVSNVLPA